MKQTLKLLHQKLDAIYGRHEADAIIRLIFSHLKGWSPTDLVIHSDDNLSDFVKQEIDRIIDRLMKHEPIQYIIGEARFHGLNLIVNTDVLIPRPETAELVDIILEDYKNRTDIKVLDIATGSGAIALAFARYLKFAEVSALDISPGALYIASRNASRLNVSLKLIQADILDYQATDKYDIIVSNPPYITESEKGGLQPEVRDYEPSLALFVSNQNPLVFYKAISRFALDSLETNGSLYFEINSRFHNEIARLLAAEGYKDIDVIRDFYGNYRFVKARKA